MTFKAMAGARSLLVSLAILVACCLLACQDETERLTEYREKGEAYLAEEQWPEAALEFRNMLQIDPKDASAHYGLARALLGGKGVRQAYWELQETVRLDPANLDAQLQYGQFLLFGKEEELEVAIATADTVLAADPTRAGAHVLKARALHALKRNAEAEEAYRLGVEASPDEPGPWLLYARFLRSEGRAAEAEPLFRKLPEIRDDFRTRAALASFLGGVPGREVEAEAAYREALAVAESDDRTAAYALLANFYFAKGRNEEAVATMRQGIEDVEDNLRLIYGLARYYNTIGDRALAEEMIEEATLARPGEAEPFLLLSLHRSGSNDLEGSLEAAEMALEADPENLSARLRKAEVLLDLGLRDGDEARVLEGRVVIDEVLSEDAGSPEGLYVKSKLDLAERNVDDALVALRRVIDTRPDWAQAHFLLGSALILDGDKTAARAEVARALELDANLLPALRMLAKIHQSLGDNLLAIETGRRVLERKPDDTQMRVLVAQSMVTERRFDDALEELQKIPEDAVGAKENYALGRVYFLKGERESAREYLLAAAELTPHQYEILRALLDLDMRDGRLEDSLERINEARRVNPDDAGLMQLHGEVSLYSGRPADAETSFRRAIDLDPNDLRAYQNLARYLAVAGRPEEVLATYETALESNQESATLHLIVGSLYELRDQEVEAMERYEDAIRLDPSLAVAKNNLAYLLAENGGNLDRALDLAQEAKAILPDNPNTADTLGWVLYRKNVPSAAVGYLREAEGGMAPEDPQVALVRHHLALAYEATGELERAREVLERAISDLDRVFGEGEESATQEPPWAAEIRSMQERLSGPT